MRATAIELEPLGESDSEELIEALLDDEPRAVRARRDAARRRPRATRSSSRRRCGCSPRTATASGIERIPDTLQALIAARIDRLPPSEKALLQRAAVIGRIFWEGALEQLSPELERSSALLDDLLLRDFVLARRARRSAASAPTASSTS